MSRADVSGLLAELEAPAPSPAGGTAAATVAAMAASLVVMVGRGSPAWPEGSGVADRAATLRDRLLVLGDEDVAAFAEVLAAFRARRGGEPAPLAPALTRASEVPLQIAELAADVAELAARAAQDGKAPMRADAAIAARLAGAASQAAAVLVGVNLDPVPVDQRTPRMTELAEAARALTERTEAG